MKNLIIYVLINFFINISFSQTKLTELATGPKNVEDIQTYSIGDSLFIAVNWFNANANEIFKKGYWINVQSGETSSYDLGVIQKGILSGIEKKDGFYYYYFVDDNDITRDGFVMKSIKQESEKKQIVRFNERVNFAGKLLGSQNSPHGLIVLSFDHKNNTIQIKILSKGIEVDNNVVELPIRFRNDPVFFANDKFPSVEDGAEKNKLFYQDEILTLVSDEEGTDTKLITLNTRTSESHVRKIPTYFNGVGRPKYVSFFRDSLLYKISRITDNVLLTVYHVNQEKEILKKLFVQSGNEPKNYFRSDKEMTVGHTGSVKSLLNSTYNWSLILEPKFDKKSTDLLVFVNFYDGKGIGILSMANPAYGLASFAIHTALRQTFGKGAGYSTYCYMVGDTNNSYNLMTQFATDKPIRQLIDDHEIAEGYGKVRFDSKNYQLVKSSVCAVYNIKGRQSLLIVKF